MPINIEMPKLSDTMTEGTVIRWLKQVGDEIEIGDEVAEIETDKATMAMEAFDEGTLARIFVEEGGKAAIGSALAVLTAPGESLEESADGSPAPEDAAGPAPDPQPATGSAAKPPTPTPVPAAATPVASGGRVKASPLARKLAEASGVDLGALLGTGPGGRIVKADIERAASSPTPASAPAPVSTPVPAAAPVPAPVPVPSPVSPAQSPASPAPAPQAVTPVVSGEDQRVELSNMRRIIAERLLLSKNTIPHFYLHMDVDAAALMDIRKQVNAQAEASHGNKYTVNDFILKAVINALQAVPAVNASFNGDHIVQFSHIGVAVAVAVDDGLVTPVVKDAAAKSLLQISRDVKDLATRARDNALKPNEFDGATFTVSNLGAFGVESFDAIINPPHAAILSVGAIVEKPVAVDGELRVGLRMDLGLSCDHRVVDGAIGARFLGEVKKLIENPALMLV